MSVSRRESPWPTGPVLLSGCIDLDLGLSSYLEFLGDLLGCLLSIAKDHNQTLVVHQWTLPGDSYWRSSFDLEGFFLCISSGGNGQECTVQKFLKLLRKPLQNSSDGWNACYHLFFCCSKNKWLDSLRSLPTPVCWSAGTEDCPPVLSSSFC